MKKKSIPILILCVLSICSSGYSANNMPENQQMQNMPQQEPQGNQIMNMPTPPRMMNRMRMMQITEQDLYSNLNAQDKALFDKLTPEQKEFVVRAVNMAPELHMKMRQQMMQDR